MTQTALSSHRAVSRTRTSRTRLGLPRYRRSVDVMQPDPLEAPLETPIEDAAEQATTADPADDAADRDYADDVHRGMEVDEWDATEQARTVDVTDDYS